MNKIFTLALLTFVSVHSVQSAELKKSPCDLSKCPSIAKHYEELGCEAIKTNDDDDDCCVRSFNCPDLTLRERNKCFYKNETYSVRETIKESQVVGSCNVGCFCAEGHDDDPAEFRCAIVDCPEFFHSGYNPNKTCVMQYKKEDCCASHTVCDDEPEVWKTLATCYFEGETYREGQKMYANDKCVKCYCTKDFNNQTAIEGNPNCEKIDCSIPLRNTGRLLEGCVPMYYKNDQCCPITWKCPDEEDTMQGNATFTLKSASEPICKFGKLKFNIGDSLDMGDEPCQKCSCLVPPMLTCVQSC